MQRLALLACAAFAVGAFCSSPVGAQQTPREQLPVPVQQPTSEEVPPPPAPQAEPVPPPFPPMPRARPSHRWVDTGNHHSRRSHPRTARAHHRRTHNSHRRHKPVPTAHFARRTVRSCHGMTYRQIMRHGSCRSLMRQELAAAAHRHRHATHRHRSSGHRHRARRGHAARRT
jgi:hypothetical protein